MHEITQAVAALQVPAAPAPVSEMPVDDISFQRTMVGAEQMVRAGQLASPEGSPGAAASAASTSSGPRVVLPPGQP
eukprot:8597593-Alexandrium_andersonii.AAC.1